MTGTPRPSRPVVRSAFLTRLPRLLCLVAAVALVSLVPATESACDTLTTAQTGGDGFLPILSPDNKIYNVYHHQDARVQCTNPATASRCTGYPSDAIRLNPLLAALDWPTLTGVPGITLAGAVTEANVDGVQFRCLNPNDPSCFHLLIPVSFGMSTDLYYFGVVCYDTMTSTLCASNPVAILNPTAVYQRAKLSFGGIHSLIRHGNVLYSIDPGMNLLCYDLSTSQSCPGFPRSLSPVLTPADSVLGDPVSFSAMRSLDYNGRPSLYIAVAYGSFWIGQTNAVITCLDLNTLNYCSEFGAAAYALTTAQTDRAFEIFFDRDTNGNPVSICFYARFEGANRRCIQIANPSVVASSAVLDTLFLMTSGAGMIHQLTINNRMYFGAYPSTGLYCYDFATQDSCTNFPITIGVSTQDYGAVYDAASGCFFALGHTNYLYSFDSLGNSPCLSAFQPVANDDSYIVPDMSQVTFNVISNDVDFDPLSLFVVVAPASPNIAVSGTQIIFTPTQALDSFQYRICTPGFGAGSDTATVTVRVCSDLCDFDNDGISNFDDLDDDNDGIPDSVEGFADPDNDGSQNSLDTDSDGDGIPDLIEILQRSPTETSSTLPSVGGTPLDGDNDQMIDGPVGSNGIPDIIETFPDSGVLIPALTRPDFDGDGVRDYVDSDSDNDGISDSVEGSNDFDGDGFPNFVDLDSDNDGLCDLFENIQDTLSLPSRFNLITPAGYELDSNGDCVLDDTNGDSIIDITDVGPNGIINSIETFPESGSLIPHLNHPDSDGDSFPDFIDVDSDNDGVPDATDNCPTASNPTQQDSNNDGVGDACACFPDRTPPVLTCLPTLSAITNTATYTVDLTPSSILVDRVDNCGLIALYTVDKPLLTLRDSLAPVKVTASGTDPSGNVGVCKTDVTVVIQGSIITNPSFSLLSIRRGKTFTITWNTNVQSFGPDDTITIKLLTTSGTTVWTPVDRKRFTLGSYSVVFPTSISPSITYQLAVFLNTNIPAGKNVVKFF